MSTRAIGRHRAPRQPLLSALGVGLTTHSRPAVRATTAVLLAGGLVTSVTVPAGADPDGRTGVDAAGTTHDSDLSWTELDAVSSAWSQRDADEARAQAEADAQARAHEVAAQRRADEQAAAQAIREAAARQAAIEKAAIEKAAAKKAAIEKAAAKKTAARKAALKQAAARKAALKKAAARRAAAQRSAALSKTAATRGDLRSASGAMSGGAVLGIASGLSGIAYRWGGTTTSGFDCSGFTQHVFKRAGINLPRTAAAQQGATRSVSNPRPGDLVFFGSPAHHVGIYAGNGRMYDSPRSGKSTGLHKIWSSNVNYGRAG